MDTKIKSAIKILLLLMAILLLSCAQKLIDKARVYGIKKSEQLLILKKLARKYPEQQQIKDIEIHIINLEFAIQGDYPDFKQISDEYSKWNSQKMNKALDDQSYKFATKAVRSNYALSRKRLKNYLDAFPNGTHRDNAKKIFDIIKEPRNTYKIKSHRTCKDSKRINAKGLFPTLKSILEGFGLTENDTLPGHTFTISLCVTADKQNYIKESDKRLYEKGWNHIKTYQVPTWYKVNGKLSHRNNNTGELGCKSNINVVSYPRDKIVIDESSYKSYIPQEAKEKYFDATLASLLSVLTQTYGYDSLVSFLKKRKLNRLPPKTAEAVLRALKPHITPEELSRLKSLL